MLYTIKINSKVFNMLINYKIKYKQEDYSSQLTRVRTISYIALVK